MDPPNGLANTIGRNCAATVAPTHTALPVNWNNTYGRTKFIIHVPTFDNNAPDQKMR